MDEIRGLACRLALDTPFSQSFDSSMKASATAHIEVARLWENYLREAIPGFVTDDVADHEEAPFQLTEDDVMRAMMGENPEVLQILRDAQAGLLDISVRAEKVFQPPAEESADHG